MTRYCIILVVSLLTGCKKVPAQVITSEDLTENQFFWKQKNKIEKATTDKDVFPKKIDSLQTKEQRINRIYLRSSYCQYELFVNDVLVSRTMGEITKGGGGITGAMPINQNLMFSGVHEIKLRMYPKYPLLAFNNRGGTVSMNFYYFIDDLRNQTYNKKMGGEIGISIGESEYHKGEIRGAENPPHKIEGLPVYEWRTTFEASVPFEVEGWLNSINLKEEQEEKKLKSELLLAYKELYKIIAKRDVLAYLEAVKLRENRISNAFYLTKEEQEKRNAEFINLLEDKNYEMLPIAEETIVLEYQGYGKLGILSDVRDGEGIIRLRNKENPDEIVTLDFRFHRKKKGATLSVI
ncbi:hypothetical protein [Tenacibaculum ovolyticum]|uniref:hypothetical protein n=1 Tax=Tenacibaculum ovolyticum TaxID=104270 RepID=UPI0004195013|nr:hypothetical protein [Tenacibaculum ovolyticum]